MLIPGSGVQTRDTATEIYRLAGAQKGLFFSSGTIMKLKYADADALPQLEPLSPGAAITEFEKYARFGKGGGKEGSETVLSKSTAEAILLFEGAKDLLPNVKGLLNCPLPVLRNGHIEILKPGYNSETKLIVAGGSIIEPETLEQAVDYIHLILQDFRFQTDADISRAVACLLTPALKIGGFIKSHTPIHIIEANESQIGKGYLLKLRDLLYGEKAFLVPRPKGGVGSMDETFSTALLTGRPFIQFDNIRRRIEERVAGSVSYQPRLSVGSGAFCRLQIG